MYKFTILLLFCGLLGAVGQSLQKYKFCTVNVPNSKKQVKYCPILADGETSEAECIIGLDRLDCFRKLTEKKADFAIFEPEDLLIVSDNEKVDDLMVVGEIRLIKDEIFQDDVVTVVRKSIPIQSLSDLKHRNFCHPGYGYQRDWPEIISQYFEDTIVTQSCEEELTSAENRIKSLATYFNEACKAGPWIPDKTLDAKLKNQYQSLCALCKNPEMCSTNDKYWGQNGTLHCLTDGTGDVAWVPLKHVKLHFGLSSGSFPLASPEGYRFLCPNGSTIPISATETCPWISRPWPVIVTEKDLSRAIKEILTFNNPKSDTWQWALQHLISQHRESIVITDDTSIENYILKAPGYQNASERAHCNPIGKVRFCTSSSIEHFKCLGLKATAVTYGIEPELDCLQMDSKLECMRAVAEDTADLLEIDANQEYTAKNTYHLKPVLFETTRTFGNFYITTAVVRANSNISKIQDLKGKKACFTTYQGVGWNTVLAVLRQAELLPANCLLAQEMGEFFGDSCVPGVRNSTEGLSKEMEDKLCALCSDTGKSSTCSNGEDNIFSGEDGAFRCLATGGDVAFINNATIQRNTDGSNNSSWAMNLRSEDFVTICGISEDCHLGWATPGQIMINGNAKNLKKEEIFIALRQISKLFGHFHPAQTVPLKIFGPFNEQSDILFKDVAEKLVSREDLNTHSGAGLNYEEVLDDATCSKQTTVCINISLIFFSVMFAISKMF